VVEEAPPPSSDEEDVYDDVDVTKQPLVMFILPTASDACDARTAAAAVAQLGETIRFEIPSRNSQEEVRTCGPQSCVESACASDSGISHVLRQIRHVCSLSDPTTDCFPCRNNLSRIFMIDVRGTLSRVLRRWRRRTCRRLARRCRGHPRAPCSTRCCGAACARRGWCSACGP
jgi:hypothetical protein